MSHGDAHNLQRYLWRRLVNEMPRDKTNKMVVRPAKTQISLGRIWDLIVSVPDHCLSFYFSDQPGYPPSLIRVFAVRMNKAWVLSYHLRTAKTLIRLGGCPGWSESSLDAHSFSGFVMRRLKCLSHSLPSVLRGSILKTWSVHIQLAVSQTKPVKTFQSSFVWRKRKNYCSDNW